VRTSFQISYQELGASADPQDRAAAQAFSLLGVLDGPDVSLPVAARLLDRPQPAAERVLERLVDAHLLETPTPGRYRLHDLLRLYTRELARELHPEPERAAALQRAFGLYVATAWRTLSLLRPGDHRLTRADDRWRDGLELADDNAALSWLEAERANLLAAVQQAAATPGVPAAVAVQLAQALFGFYLVHAYCEDWVLVNRAALEAACRVGDQAAQAQAHNDLGVANTRLGRCDRAVACQQESLAIRRELGDRHGEAISLNALGIAHRRQGQHQRAVACHQESLAIARDLDDSRCQAESLRELGVTLRALGRPEEARARWRQALAIFERLQSADADQVRALLADDPG
jgi:tetratricopeptide (TPR) repeat protein